MFLFRGFELFRTVLSVKRLWCHVKGFPPSPSTEDGCKKSRLTAERKRHWWSQIFICEPSTAGLISQKEVSVNHLKHKKKLVENADHVVYACLCWIFFCGVCHCIFTLVSCLMRKWMIQIANKTLPAYTCISKEKNMSCTQTQHEETPAKLERLSCNYLNLNM